MPDASCAPAAGDRLLWAQIFASLEHRPALLCLFCRFGHAEAQAGAIPLPVFSFSLEEVKQLISIPGGIPTAKNSRKKLFLVLLLQHLVPVFSLSGAPEIDFRIICLSLRFLARYCHSTDYRKVTAAPACAR